MKKDKDVEIAIIGAGIAGIATAYYLCQEYGRRSVVLIDSRDPMSYTSAQSGDNYRNWWPHPVMADFTNHSIDLMEKIARDSSNILQMNRRGYAVATRSDNIDDLLAGLEASYPGADEQIRIHDSPAASSYPEPNADNWQSKVAGVDVLSNKALIQKTFPAFSTEIQNVLHIRRAGDISGQQLGQYMLQQVKPLGCKRIRGSVVGLSRNKSYQLEIKTPDKVVNINADIIINAAGPFVGDIGEMLGIDLPVSNTFHQKIAFEDHLCAIPRDQPFSIDIDERTLDWSADELSMLADDPALGWLTRPIEGGTHCRPEGGLSGNWIKLGWAYNRLTSIPDDSKELVEDARFDPHFPEIVMRGAAALNPGLKQYYEALPPKRIHYGGYYTMTEENWPLIGPMDDAGAYIVGALSGFGSMAACASGALCAAWICHGKLPDYAPALSFSRYNNQELMSQIRQAENIGLL